MRVFRVSEVSDDRRAFTLIELAITVALVAIIAAIAIPSISNFISRYRLNRAAERFSMHVSQCRTSAISNNLECAIQLTDLDEDPTVGHWKDNEGVYQLLTGDRPSGSTSWSPLSIGAGYADGVVDLGQGWSEIEGVSIVEWSSMAGAGSGTLPDALVFGSHGYMTNEPTDFTDTYLRVVFQNKAANFEEQRAVLVDRGGTPYIVIP